MASRGFCACCGDVAPAEVPPALLSACCCPWGCSGSPGAQRHELELTTLRSACREQLWCCLRCWGQRGVPAVHRPPQDPLGDPQALSDTLSLHNTSLLPPLPGFAERGGRAQRAGTGKLPTSASNCSQPRARIPCAWLHRWLVPPLAMFGRMPAPLAAPQGAAATPRVGPAGRGAPMGAPMNPRMLQGMGPSLPGLDPPAPPCSIPRVLPRAGQS